MDNIRLSTATKCHMSKRVIAFILSLAMVMGIFPAAVFAEGETGTLKGGVYFSTLDEKGTQLTETDTGAEIITHNVFNASSMMGGTFTARIRYELVGKTYSDGKNIRDYINFTDFVNSDTLANSLYTYTLVTEEDGNCYVEVTGIKASYTTDIELGVIFLDGVNIDGTTLRTTLYKVDNSTETQIEHDTYPNPNSIKVNAEPELTTEKSANKSSIEFDKNGKPTDTITYTIDVTPENAGQEIGRGDTRITSYTVTDTVYLPTGLSVADTDQMKKAFKLYDSNGSAITDITVSPKIFPDTPENGPYTSFEVSWTAANTADTQMAAAEYTASLNCSELTAEQGFRAGTIMNEAKTDYTYNSFVIENGAGTEKAKTKTSTADPVQTSIIEKGNGLGSAAKSLYWDNHWSGWNYVVQGDTINYSITVTNDSSGTKYYTIEDDLNKWGLAYGSLIGEDSSVTVTTDTEDNKNTVYFAFELAEGASKTINFSTTVAPATSFVDDLIVNEAAISVYSDSARKTKTAEGTVVAPPVTEKAPLPELYMTKDAQQNGSSISYVEANDTFNYVITINNNGTGDASGVSFTDALPNGVTLNGSVTYKIGETITTVDSYTGAISGLTIPKGSTCVVTIPVRVNGSDVPETIVNTAKADYKAGNEDRSVTAAKTLENSAIIYDDLSITKTADKTIVQAGENVTYTVTIANSNPKNAYTDTITILEAPDECLEYQSISGASYNNGTITVENDIASGETYAFTITYKVKSDYTSGKVENSVTIKNPDENGNSSAVGSVTIPVGESNLSVTKTASYTVNGETKTINNGETGVVPANTEVTFKITAQNTSATQKLTDIRITDIINGSYTKTPNEFNIVTTNNGSVMEYKNDWGDVTGDVTVYSNYAFNIDFKQNTQNNATSSGWNGIWISQDDAVIAPNTSVTFTYTLTTADDTWIGGSNTATGYVNIDSAYVKEGDTQVVTLATPTPSPVPTADPSATEAPAAISVTKTAKYYDIDTEAYVTLKDGDPVPADAELTFDIQVENTGGKDIVGFSFEDTIAGAGGVSLAESYVTENGSIPTKLTVTKNGKDIEFFANNYNNEKITVKNKDVYINSSGEYKVQLKKEQYYRGCNISNPLEIIAQTVENWTWDGSQNVVTYADYNVDEITLKPGDYMDFTYSVKTASKTNWNGGSNSVKVTAKDGEETLTKTASISYTKGTSSTSNAVLDITKTAGTKSYLMTESGDDFIFDYTVTLTNNSLLPYTSTGMTFTDTIPEGLDFYVPVNTNEQMISVLGQDQWNSLEYKTNDDNPGERQVNIKTENEAELTTIKQYYSDWGYGNVNYSDFLKTYLKTDDGYKQNLTVNKLIISFPNEVTILAGKSITITYKLVVPKAKAAEYYSKAMTSGTDDYLQTVDLKNEITFEADTKFKNSAGTRVDQISTSETVSLIPPIIHPGITKEYMGWASAGGSTAAGSMATSLNAYLIFKVTVYNGYDTKGITMHDYTVEDIVPANYKYYTSRHNAVSNYVINYDASGNAANLDTAPPTLSGGAISFSDSKYDIVPGGRLELYVVLEPVNAEYGLYTNTARVNPTQDFAEESVTIGAYNANSGDPVVEASASAPVLPLQTSAEKSVAYNGTTVYGSADEPDNKIKARLGDDVTYTLEVKNSSGYAMADFAVIDRLPYVGDTGVASGGGRGSAFSMAYDYGMKATVKLSNGTEYDITNYIDVAYGVDTTKELAESKKKRIYFTEGDADWSYKTTVSGGRVVWTKEVTNTTNLVRFALADTIKDSSYKNVFKDTFTEGGESTLVYGIPSGATVRISFNAKVPDYIGNMSETGVAWNSFAYYYNSQDYQDMMAEPGRVGVYVDDKVYKGQILVRKIFKSNITTKARNFYMALYQSPYDTSATDAANAANLVAVKPITLMGTPSGSQADIYFMNLEYPTDGSNQAYYIYESDESGVPLTAAAVSGGYDDETYKLTNELTASTVTIDADGKVSESGNGGTINYKQASKNNPANVAFIMDNIGQQKQERNQKIENSKYFVWNKDLSESKTSNSAVFTNMYFADADISYFGPFYADVPTAQDNGASDSMTSSAYADGEVHDRVKSTERGGEDQYGGDGLHNHTISTGFLAQITGVRDFSINNTIWTITANPSTDNDVYVRLRLDEANGTKSEKVNTGVTEVETHGKTMTVSEFKEQYGDSSITEASDFKDYNTTADGTYAIFKLNPNNNTPYTWTINDITPQTKLKADETIYLGVILDQLYDRQATASLELLDDVYTGDGSLADAAEIADAKGSHNLRYTGVESPYQSDDYRGNKLMTVKKTTKVGFLPADWSYTAKTTITETVLNEDRTANIIATEGKTVVLDDPKKEYTVNGKNKYTGWLQLGGAGSTSSRAIAINVDLKAGDAIKVEAVSSSKEANRTLIVAGIDKDGNPYELGTIMAPGYSNKNVNGYTDTITLNAAYTGPLYIYSKASGINVHSVTVTVK